MYSRWVLVSIGAVQVNSQILRSYLSFAKPVWRRIFLFCCQRSAGIRETWLRGSSAATQVPAGLPHRTSCPCSDCHVSPALPDLLGTDRTVEKIFVNVFLGGNRPPVPVYLFLKFTGLSLLYWCPLGWAHAQTEKHTPLARSSIFA